MSCGSLETSNINVFDVFYDMLKQINESNRHNACSKTVVRDGQFVQDLLAPLETLHIPFSGEEGLGRYLDLHKFYNAYINSKFGHCLSYTDYLGEFPGLDNENVIPSKLKATGEYKTYVKDVLCYLVSFMDRARPLTFLDRLFKDLERQFEERNHQNRGKKRARSETGGGELMDDASKVEDLMVDGSETALLKKKENGRETALLEAKVKKVCEVLSETLEQTRQHVQNKQAMSQPERERDGEDNETVESDEDGDNNEIRNPLKLPMGWDGRPIPYWLYKLHGLNKEFKCEICGDHTYTGRRAFETHFKEPRHQHGMHCLGIPNTKAFNEITSIQDAKNLWDQIQLRQGLNKWSPDVDEEFEDDDGNVYDKKTYTYLARQGLI